MREFKFRVYDKERKKIKFFDLKEIYADCYHNVGFLKNAPHEHENDGWEQFELMQFTGLLDKNGKEIYEGDIVRYEDYANSKKVVKWDDDRVGFLFKRKGQYDGLLNLMKVIVIGNIYENPELLTEK